MKSGYDDETLAGGTPDEWEHENNICDECGGLWSDHKFYGQDELGWPETTLCPPLACLERAIDYINDFELDEELIMVKMYIEWAVETLTHEKGAIQ